MPIKEIADFTGIMPRVNAALLPDNAAQVALNCTLWKGDLRSLKEPVTVVTPSALSQAIKSIYRIGQSLPQTQYWMAWTTDVDVVRGMIADDTSERTYFTGNGVPKVTDLALATQGGTTYPVNAWTLGIPKPAQAPDCTATATAPIVTRVYVYTYVSGWGEEGKPSDPTKVQLSEGGIVTLSNMSTAPAGNFNITHKRIYRGQQTSSGQPILRLVAQIPVAHTTYNDMVADADLTDTILTSAFDMPPETMSGLIALPNGIMAAFNGYDVLFCEPYHPYAWPAAYSQTVDYPVVGLGVYGTSVVVLTKGNPYVISGSHPENMSMERLDLQQACVSKRSIISADGGVVYASPDGLVYIGGGGARVITEDKFTREDWQAIQPATIHAYWTERRYIAVHATGGFILDIGKGGELTLFNDTATAGYVDLVNDTLYLCIGGAIKAFNAGAAKTYTWRSKKFVHNGRTPYAFGQVDADAYPVTFKMYWEGALKQTKVVNDSRPFALAGGSRVRELEFEFSGTNPMRYAAVADSVEELRVG